MKRPEMDGQESSEAKRPKEAPDATALADRENTLLLKVGPFKGF